MRAAAGGSRRPRARRWLALGALATLGACATRNELQLDPGSARKLEPLESFAARLPRPLTAGAPGAVVVSRSDALAGGVLEPGKVPFFWRRTSQLSAPPLLARELVVYGEGRWLQALDARSGEPLWTVQRQGARLHALADDGQLSALALESERADRHWLLVIDRAGRERLRVQLPNELGTPALLPSLLLVPWGGRFVSTIDLGSGAELARAGVEPGVQHALWSGSELWLAGPPWLHLTGSNEAGTPPGHSRGLPSRPLPGQVELGSAALAPHLGADTSRLFAVPPAAEAEPATSYLVVQGRAALSFESSRGTLLWVRSSASPILGAAARPESFALCEANGVLQVLAAGSARPLEQLQLSAPPGEQSSGAPERRNEPWSHCALAAGSGWPPAPPASAREVAPEELVEQLARVLARSEPDLANLQRFLSRELAARPEPEATRVLIALASRQSADPILQAEAEDLLATRRNGVDFMLQALERAGPAHDPVARAPLGALADALAALEEKRAAPLLAAQLNQLGHTAAAVERVARALEVLASESEYDALRVFFSVWRTSADGPELVAAVQSVGRTLLRIGAAPGRRLVQLAARDPLTVPEVRAELERELSRD